MGRFAQFWRVGRSLSRDFGGAYGHLGLAIFRFCRSWANGLSGCISFVKFFSDLHRFEWEIHGSLGICGRAWQHIWAWNFQVLWINGRRRLPWCRFYGLMSSAALTVFDIGKAVVKPQVSLLSRSAAQVALNNVQAKNSLQVFFFRWHVYFCRLISHFFWGLVQYFLSDSLIHFFLSDSMIHFFLSDTLIFQGGYVILWKYGTLTFYTCFSFCLLASEDPYIKSPRACTNLYKQPWVGSMIL